MTEPEVSLWLAIHYIERDEVAGNATVSIDGAHLRTGARHHFDAAAFLRERGYQKCDGTADWKGEYAHPLHASRLVLTSAAGIGDVTLTLENGEVVYAEAKKFKAGKGPEYPAMREAIGQLMTGACPADAVPVVAVPYNAKSTELAVRWASMPRVRAAGIRFALVGEEGSVHTVSRVTVLPYDPAWPSAFRKIERELRSALGALAVSVEHVGSTAVAGLAAKPCIDIDVVISDTTPLADVACALAAIGYTHEGDLGIAGREAFDYADKPHLYPHHLYVLRASSAELRRHLALRDYLRTHPEAAARYGQIKTEGAALYPNDIEKYIAHKAPYIAEIYGLCGLV